MKLLIRPRPAAMKGPRHRRILAICGNTQVGLWMVRDLGRAGLKVFSLVTAPSGLAAHSRYSSGAWIVESPPHDPGFVDEVESLARRLDVGSVITISETYHSVLIPQRSRFEPDIHLFSPSADCFAKATDKDYLQRLCRDLGIPVARGTTLDELMAGREELRFPLVLRTKSFHDPLRTGTAPWKAAYAETPEQLNQLYEQVADFAANVLVQEYHPGVEDHVQILMHEGEAFMAGEYIGEHHMPLAGGVTVQRVTCRHEGLIRDAVNLLKALDWQGITGAQFHYDPATDRYIFLEINPRFIGGLPTVIMAGFRAPLLLWQSYFEPERMQRQSYELGLRTRVLGGDANWMFAMIRGDQLPPGQKRIGKLSTVGRFGWNFGPWTRDDVFCLGDVKPALADWREMLKHLGAESVDIVGHPQTQESAR